MKSNYLNESNGVITVMGMVFLAIQSAEEQGFEIKQEDKDLIVRCAFQTARIIVDKLKKEKRVLLDFSLNDESVQLNAWDLKDKPRARDILVEQPDKLGEEYCLLSLGFPNQDKKPILSFVKEDLQQAFVAGHFGLNGSYGEIAAEYFSIL